MTQFILLFHNLGSNLQEQTDLRKNHLYHSLLAELYVGIDKKKQIEHLKLALTLTDNEKDHRILMTKLNNASV